MLFLHHSQVCGDVFRLVWPGAHSTQPDSLSPGGGKDAQQVVVFIVVHGYLLNVEYPNSPPNPPTLAIY